MLVLKRCIKKLKNLAGEVDRWSYARGLRSTHNLALPDFLGIGAQKSGTSWLAANLRFHPEIFLSDEKEVHYFDRDYHRSLRYYASLFARAGDRVKGEITPAYAILDPKMIRFIQQLMPDLRLIYIIRNPVDRAWSQAYMNLVSIPGRAFDEVGKDEFINHFRSPRSVLRGDYQQCVDNWLACFSEDQLLIEFFEDIARQPQQLLERVFDHLHVSRPTDWDLFPLGEKVFAGDTEPMPAEFREILAEMYASEIEALYQRFGEKTSAWRIPDRSTGGPP